MGYSKIIISAAAMSLLAAVTLKADVGKNFGQLNEQDRKFIQTDGQGLVFEVQAGELAQNHSSSGPVQAFGQRMVHDHSQDYDQLKALGQQKGVPVPTQPSQEQQEEVRKLSNLYGAAFDKEYITYEIGDHQQDIKDHCDELEKGSDEDVQLFAANHTAELVQHLHLAVDTARQLGIFPH